MIPIYHRDGHILWDEPGDSLREAVETAVRCALALGSADLAGADLRDAILLVGADLRDAILVGAILVGADLRGARLQGAAIYHADLTSADLRDSDLTGADLTGAHLECADLEGATGYRYPDAPDPRELRRLVADHIEHHPELHDQGEWGDGTPKCGTPCCVAGWACRLGGGPRGESVSTAAIRLLWLDGAPMPSFMGDAGREEILAALRVGVRP